VIGSRQPAARLPGVVTSHCDHAPVGTDRLLTQNSELRAVGVSQAQDDARREARRVR
jgi:hypothetical protein